MAKMQYNPVQDNFYTYEAVETPQVNFKLPLLNEDLDISSWSRGVVEKENEVSVPLSKGTNLAQAIFNDSPTRGEAPQERVEPIVTTVSNSGSPQERARDFFINKGLTPHIAAGIVGNLIVESGLDPTAVGDNGSAYGLAQWRLDRRDNLKKFAKERGKDISDFDTQLEFLWHELNGNYKQVLNKLLGARDATQATDIFMRGYERPNPTYAHFKRRAAYTNSLI